VQPPLVPLVYRTWPDYETLKEAATALYYQQKQEVRDTFVRKATGASIAGYRENIDWMLYDAFSSIRLIEEFGELLEYDGSIGLDGRANPLRTDLCDCHNVLKCPNGTSSPTGSSDLNDCKPCCSGVAGESAASCYTDETLTCRTRGAAMVLRRYDLIPTHAVEDFKKTMYVIKYPGTSGAPADAENDFSFGEGGTYGGRPCSLGDVGCEQAPEFADLTGNEGAGASLGHLRLWTFDIATITSDLRKLERNFTYGAHYRLAVYEDCKPCPTEYACQFTGDFDPERGYDCSEPEGPTQILRYKRCLNERRTRYCVNASYPFVNVVRPGADCERLVDGQVVSLSKARRKWKANDEVFVPNYGKGVVLQCTGQNDVDCVVALDLWEYNREPAEMHLSAWTLQDPGDHAADLEALQALLDAKQDCFQWSIPHRPRTLNCGGHHPGAQNLEYLDDTLTGDVVRGVGDFYLKLVTQPEVPLEEVGNVVRILAPEEIGPGVRRFSMPNRYLCSRTPFYCKTRSHAPFEFTTLPIVTEVSIDQNPETGGWYPGTGQDIPAVLGTTSEIEAAALEELIQLEVDTGDVLLCAADVVEDEFQEKKEVRQYGDMTVRPTDPPGVRWCEPMQAERPPGFGEDVLREKRERLGNNAGEAEYYSQREQRHLDEHFFLYNEVPDVGGWATSDFRNAIQQQGCCLCEDKRKRLPRFFRETTKNPGLEDNKHALVQTTYTMVGRLYVDLTITWELLSGLYSKEFDGVFDASDVAIHRPSRVNEGTDFMWTKDGTVGGYPACRNTNDKASDMYGKGNCGVPHLATGEAGTVAKADGDSDLRRAPADRYLLQENARSSFLTILSVDLMEENRIEMPFNIPFTTLPPSQKDLLLVFPRILEPRVIINRPSLTEVSDPECWSNQALKCVEPRGNPLMDVEKEGVIIGMRDYTSRKRLRLARLGLVEEELEAATDRRVTENHYPSDDNPYDSLYPVDDRGKTGELDPESQEVTAKELFDGGVSLLAQAIKAEGSTAMAGVRGKEGRGLGDIAGLASSYPDIQCVGNCETSGWAGVGAEAAHQDPAKPPQVMAFPWLPFFSNCRGYDSQIPYSKLLESHPGCNLEQKTNTEFINDYDPLEQLFTKLYWSSAAVADTCVGGETAKRMQKTNDDGAWDLWEGISLVCQYEEDLTKQPEARVRWYEASGGTRLWEMSADPIPPSMFAGYIYSMDLEKWPAYDGLWGTHPEFTKMRGTENIIGTVVDESWAGSFAGELGMLPARVTLSLYFFQESRDKKKLVASLLKLHKETDPQPGGKTDAASGVQTAPRDTSPPACCIVQRHAGKCTYEDSDKKVIIIPPCETVWNSPKILKAQHRAYELQVIFTALNWFELLNYFRFKDPLYTLFYTMLGAITVFEGFIIWGLNRLLTKLRHPPVFHGATLFYTIAEAPVKGTLYASIPYMLALALVFHWFATPAQQYPRSDVTPPQLSSMEQTTTYVSSGTGGQSNPSNMGLEWLAFEKFAATWKDYEAAYGYSEMFFWKMGRAGLCFMVIGLYGIFLSAKLIIPNWTDLNNGEEEEELGGDEEEELPESPTWAPNTWKRAHWMWTGIMFNFYYNFLLEFSYWPIFSQQVYSFLVLLYFLDIGIAMMMESILCESLLIAPIDVCINVIENTMTMGAASFVDFTVSFMVGLSIMMLDRLYFGPAVDTVTTLVPRWKMMLKRKFQARRRMTREEKAAEELEWRRINEEIELSAEGVEPLLGAYSGYSVEVTAMLIFPFLNMFMMYFPMETQITIKYGISTFMSKYFIFALYMPLYQLMLDVFILNTQELVYGWKVYDYVSYQRYRFSVRDQRWMMNSKVLDESIAESLQTLDLMCFSEQYYFLIALISFGMLLVTMGVTTFINTNYNFFGDPVMPIIVMVMLFYCDFLQWVLFKAADIRVRKLKWRGLWMTKQIEGTVDDDVAVKLAIGEGRQADLEQERLELQALNSERFRHRFLERNRPWILQHLVELLTPRSLEQPGHDGRPVVEYVRDVYAELVALGEGTRKPGDRDDISSDDDDEMERARASWPRAPLRGAALVIARLWLDKARKRRAFARHVQGLMLAQKRSACDLTGRTEAMGAKLVCTLATNGKPDKNAIDDLIAGFEEAYGPNERDVNLWKAYFRGRAEFITVDQAILDANERERVARQAQRPPGAGRATRADDVSSDSEEEDCAFDPLVVVRTSLEGRMLSKWLGAARKRMGGEFPRDAARAEMEAYAEKMRRRKLKGGKQNVAGVMEDDATAAARLEKRVVRLTQASSALARRWLRAAQDSIANRFRERGEVLRRDCEACLEDMPAEDEWFYGADLRFEGRQVLTRGDSLRADQLTLEAEAAVRVRRIEADFQRFEAETRVTIDEARYAFEERLRKLSEGADRTLEIRTRELERTKEVRRGECDAAEQRERDEEGAASAATLATHREILESLDDEIRSLRGAVETERKNYEGAQRNVFDRHEGLQQQVISDRRISAITNIRQIRKETQSKIRSDEGKWQNDAARWLGTGRRKVELKQREDADVTAAKRRRGR